MYQYDAVLFDMDGTLLNTLHDLSAAVNHTLRAFGYPAREMDEVRAFVGNGVRKLIERRQAELQKIAARRDQRSTDEAAQRALGAAGRGHPLATHST